MVGLVKLFEPMKMGDMILRNRIVMAPMGTRFSGVSGEVSQRILDYYVKRAEGGVGLIIVGSVCVESSLGLITRPQLCIDNDKFLPGLNRLAEAVQDCGAKIALQLHHAGQNSMATIADGKQPVSSSESRLMLPTLSTKGVRARALSVEEIHSLTKKYAEAAVRAKTVGVDAVEVQCAVYLLGSFLSPLLNKRTDEYGGDLEGRMRFPLEVVNLIRKEVGEGFPIIVRISGDEHIRGGIKLDDAKAISERFEEASVNSIHVMAGTYGSIWWSTQPMALPRGCNVPLAEGVKKVVDIPVVAVGRINDPLLAENILLEGKADLVAMGRALICDPELPKKAMEGRLDDIRICIACLRGCSERLRIGISCSLNASVGKERDYEIKLAEKAENVLIAGGGPGGMEAARVAALRGHKVTLLERNDVLGGQLNLSSVAPHKEEVQNVTKYLSGQIYKLGVTVELSKEASLQEVEKRNPDVVIVATGANPLVPQIPGVDGENVATAWNVLSGKTKLGRKIVVAGGGMVGCETAEYLAVRGKDVTIVELLEDIGLDMELRSRALLLERFSKLGIEKITNSKLAEITEKGVETIDNKWIQKTLEADNVVLALGSTPNSKLAETLENRVPELYMIGDCVKPRRILNAIHEGFKVARKL